MKHLLRCASVIAVTTLTLASCGTQDATKKIAIAPARGAGASADATSLPTSAKLDPIARYGGYVLTATTMPQHRGAAYLWAKNIGTLVAYETFLRRYPEGGDADFFRAEIRKRFLPKEQEWHEAWQFYSKMEIIEGAVCDPQEGFILLGRPGAGRLAPFHYEDLITALKCSLSKEKVGVTMTRIFEARHNAPPDPREWPHVAYETSVEFYSKKLWNTHMAYVLFEGDRMLKSLGAGYDIFLKEPIRSSIPGFRTELEMAAAEPIDPRAAAGGGGRRDYGRTWIELTSVKINTTEKKNVAMFSDVQLEVRAESKHRPPMQFAKHLRENYRKYGEEFPIFAEVERAARLVSISRWLVETYPEVAQKLVDSSYENIKVFVPQVIEARFDFTHDTPAYKAGLIGGVIFPNVNKTLPAGDRKVGDTNFDEVAPKVVQARKGGAHAWEVALGKNREDKFYAWRVPAMKSGQAQQTIRFSTLEVANTN